MDRMVDFIAVFHDAHFLVGSEYQGEGIESVAAAYAVFRADVLCVVFFKLFGGLLSQIPSAVHHLIDGVLYFFAMLGVQFLKV